VSEVWRREAVRVIVVDARARVLLTAARDPDDGRQIWFAPGGGAEPGETLEQTARREFAEEIDATFEPDLRGPVWTRHHPHTFAGKRIDLHEWYFVTNVEAERIRDVRETDDGARYFDGWRWWTIEELDSFEGILAPRRLPALLRPILAGDLPDEPIDTGI
jgi:8-oxo-dGTP pyrophosphatase MutT (NUDIX family)